MRDIATINAICWMIRNRRQVAKIPETCGGESNLIPALRRVLVENHCAYDEETESGISQDDDNYRWAVPDWKALAQVAIVFCVSEDQ
jgi:hypothetical protein